MESVLSNASRSRSCVVWSANPPSGSIVILSNVFASGDVGVDSGCGTSRQRDTAAKATIRAALVANTKRIIGVPGEAVVAEISTFFFFRQEAKNLAVEAPNGLQRSPGAERALRPRLY